MKLPSWKPDPSGHHQYRWWDGERWTDQVSDDGEVSTGPLSQGDSPHCTDAMDAKELPASDHEDSSGTGAPDWPSMQAPISQRATALLLDYLLVAGTLGIGWLIWSVFTFEKGQTPAKRLLKMRVVRLDRHKAAGMGWTALRELILKMLLPLLFVFHWLPFLLLLAVWLAANLAHLVAKQRGQTLWDRMLKTLVINDPDSRFKPLRPTRRPSTR